jgi:hypothetical protein
MEPARSVDWGRLSDKVIDPRLVEPLEYEIQVIDDSGIPELKRARKLFVGIHEDGNTLEFKKKSGSDPSLFVIPLRDIITATPVTIQTKHMMTKKDKLLVHINFARSDTVGPSISIRFDMDERYISTLLDQINHFKDEEVNPSIVRAIAVARDSKLCIQCAKKKYELKFSRDYNLCLNCFTNNYGRIIFQALQAEYYGGHKVYLSGGYSGDFQYGRLILTEHYLVFARGDKNLSKRWEIIIPLDSVIIERWGIEEISRGGYSSGVGDIGVGSGMIYGSGRAHHILVPYVDENGIPQGPRFGLSSYKGEAIRKLAAELYQHVVNEKRESAKFLSKADKQPLSQEPVSSPNIDDPLKVLKLRFAKGEITKEQYEEMRKFLES